ncbi:MAG: metallophosphoesterase [Desulfuromonadales bacterium]
MKRKKTPKSPTKGLSRRRFLQWTGLGLGGAALGNAFVREPTALQIERVDIPLPKAPAGTRVRIVQLSDTHIGPFRPYFRRVAEAANALQPDIILLTGDYIEESRNLPGALEFLQLLQAPAGIFAVQGNWEYWARIEGEPLRRQFKKIDITLLINQREDVQAGGMELSLLGLDYPSRESDFLALQEQADPRRANLLLSHVPAFNHEKLDGRLDLICCGHTHGGQVRLPFLSPLYLPRYTGGFVSGLYRVGPTATPLYVNRGIGTSLLPVRFLCRPEITLFDLVGTARN